MRKGSDSEQAYTILVVDDDAHQFRSVEQCLEQAGYRVINAQSPTEVSTACVAAKPNLLVLGHHPTGQQELAMAGEGGFLRVSAPAGTPTTQGRELISVPSNGDTSQGDVAEPAGYVQSLPLVAQHTIPTDKSSNEQSQTEQALLESEEKYRLLVENTNEAILVVQDGVLRFANTRAAQIAGCSEDELAHTPLMELVHPDDQKMVAEHDLARLRGEKLPSTYAFRIVDRAGQVRWVEINAVLITWEGRPATLNFLTDVTERRRAEEEIEELLDTIQRAKREWETIIDSLPDLVCLLDDQGRIIRANRTVETWNLGQVEAVSGKRFHGLLHPSCAHSPCYLDGFWEQAWEKASQGESAQCEVYDDVLKRHLLVRVQPCRIGESAASIGSIVIILRDVTERKQAEEARRRLLCMKEELIANVSHELRTPLFSVQGFVALILEGKVPDPVVQREFLSRVSEQAQRLIDLVNDLLDVSRLEKGQMELTKQRIQIGEIIDRIVNQLANMAREKSIALVAEAAASLPTVEVDPRRVEQVLVNLVGNALKFTPPGGRVAIGSRVEGDELLVQVSDTGMGIPKEAMPYLFSKFYQVDGSVTRPTGGTGLGLYLSKMIVEAHGGRIWAESEPNQGSVFSFTLPIT